MTEEQYLAALARFMDLRVRTMDYERGLLRLERALKLARVISSQPDCLLITGPAGSGKTWLIEEFAARHPCTTEPGKITCEVMVVHMPSSGNVVATVQALGGPPDPFVEKARNRDVAEVRVRHKLAAQRVKMLIIEEYQQSFEGKSIKDIRAQAQVVKSLYNQLKLSLVFCGLPAIVDFVMASSELKSRVTSSHFMRPMSLAVPELAQEFDRVLIQFERALPLPPAQPLNSEEMKMRLYLATGGLFRPLKHLLKAAVDAAHTEAVCKIGRDHFSAAFQRPEVDFALDKATRSGASIRLPDGSIDPFSASLDVVRKAVARALEQEISSARHLIEAGLNRPRWLDETR